MMAHEGIWCCVQGMAATWSQMMRDTAVRKSFLPTPMPVRRSNLTQLILDQLRSYVLNNGLVEEDRLPPERELATQLNVSRPSLRNALDWLEARGALRRIQGGGTFLQSNFLHVIADAREANAPNEECLRDAIEARLHLEPVLIRLVCDRAPQSELDALAEEVAKAKFRTADPAFWRWHDLQFHSRLARSGRNAVLARTLEEALSDVYLLSSQAEQFDFVRAQSEHEQIIEALIWRDADAAASRMAEHLQALSSAAEPAVEASA
jgi:GntR family transcriptional repressor for pyruvate dehydrogenase complex